MSDLVNKVAEILNAPVDLVQRSAEARAAASGVSVDDVLSSWAGGESVAASAAPAPEKEAPVEEVVEEAPVEDVVEETKRVSVSVAPAPVKETADSQEAFNQVTLPDQVGSIETPQIAHTTVNIAEQGRLATVEFFEKQQEKIQEKRADQKEEVVVINNSEDDKPKPSVQDVAQEVGQTGLLAMVGALSFISRSAWLFYGLFLLLIILVARKLIKHHRRREEY